MSFYDNYGNWYDMLPEMFCYPKWFVVEMLNPPIWKKISPSPLLTTLYYLNFTKKSIILIIFYDNYGNWYDMLPNMKCYPIWYVTRYVLWPIWYVTRYEMLPDMICYPICFVSLSWIIHIIKYLLYYPSSHAIGRLSVNHSIKTAELIELEFSGMIPLGLGMDVC